MSFFAIHDGIGRITQGSKIFAPDARYEQQLRDLGHSFVIDEKATLRSPEAWYVDRPDSADRTLAKRRDLSVIAMRNRIKAGGSDKAVLIGIPRNACVTITTGGLVVYEGKPGATELEIAIPVPCIYRIAVDLWPFKTHVTEIEAVA